ncbi:MAG: glycerophosphodiester phosphodiesterase family protein [Aeromicrobium sp.]
MIEPVIIAHRGASGYRPEHTLAGYQLAIDMGADYIEPDVVSTSDGILLARHENEISGTTDVVDHHEFADRKTTKTIDNTELTGWFTEDFTLAEIKTLRARERIPAIRDANSRFDGRFEVCTLDEIIDLMEENNVGREEPVAAYIETKHPSYFDSLGLNLDDLLLEVLGRRDLDHEGGKTIIQSMEPQNLRSLSTRTYLPLVQLMPSKGRPADFVLSGDQRTYVDLAQPHELADIATYAAGIGPNKNCVIALNKDGTLGAETALVAEAHKVGLAVHIWTMRDENVFLPKDLRKGEDKATKGNVLAEYERFFDAGVDGLFSDFTDTAVEARRDWLARRV